MRIKRLQIALKVAKCYDDVKAIPFFIKKLIAIKMLQTASKRQSSSAIYEAVSRYIAKDAVQKVMMNTILIKRKDCTGKQKGNLGSVIRSTIHQECESCDGHSVVLCFSHKMNSSACQNIAI